MNAIPSMYDRLAEAAAGYDTFILDLWGVLHDGVRAYPDAVAGLRAMKAAGKRLLVLSNAPRPVAQIAARMGEMGLTPDLYDILMSSGEDAWRHLRDRPTPWYRRLGSRMYHLGPERDAAMHEGLDVELVQDVREADFVLLTGPPDSLESVASLEPLLEAGVARGLPMICANPDLVVMRGDALELCAGAVAARYEELGGEVHYHGKPHRRIYDTCFRLLGDPDPARVVAVGDTLRTDVAGAQAAGIAAILVTGGIHGEELGVAMGERPTPDRLAALYAREGLHPTAAVPAFRW